MFTIYFKTLFNSDFFSYQQPEKKNILYKALNTANFSKIRAISPAERNKENRIVIPLLHGKQGSRAKVALKSTN